MPPFTKIFMPRSIIFKRLGLLAILTLGLMALLVPLALAESPGELDPTFSQDGLVTTTIGTNSEANALAIQDNGKIVVVGYSGSLNAPIFTMVRYNPDGSPDSNFGTGGIVTDPTGGQGFDVALQPDGKIIVTHSKGVARYLSDGNLDNTFGSGGVITSTDRGGHIAIQTGGKIIISTLNSFWYPQLSQYNPDGSLDTTFGISGVVQSPLGSEGSYALTIQPADHKIVAGGTGYKSGVAHFVTARFDAGGSLDNTFGHGGVMTTTIGDYAYGFSVALQTDGKVVVSGYAFDAINNVTNFATARYLSNGNPDNTFGQGGVVTTTIADNSVAWGVVIQSDGKIVVSGYTEDLNLNNSSFATVRYNPDSSLDHTFGFGGVVTTTIDTTSENYDVAIDPNKKIVTTGRSGGFGNSMFALARYIGQGTSQNNDAPIIGLATVLYNGALGGTPDDQGFTYFSLPGPGANNTATGGVTTLDTTSNTNIQAGYSLISPTLNRASGYTLRFTAQVITETHSGSDRNGDGVDDRAGFSVIALSSDKKGVELGFWTDQIWAQNDDTATSPPITNTLFTHGESANFNTTAGLIPYELRVLDDAYSLAVSNTEILSGSLRDYTAFSGPLDVYEIPNFIFLGDDSDSTRARVRLSHISVITNASLPDRTVGSNQPLIIDRLGLLDIDAGGQNVVVTLTVNSGVLTLTTTAPGGLTAGQISGNGSNTVVATGPLGQINTSLAFTPALIYRSQPGFFGLDPATVTINDLGHSGGPALTSQKGFNIIGPTSSIYLPAVEAAN